MHPHNAAVPGQRSSISRCGDADRSWHMCTLLWHGFQRMSIDMCGNIVCRGGGGGQAGGVGLYDEAPHVSKLTSSDFPDSAATGGGAVWLVEFYAPWYAPASALSLYPSCIQAKFVRPIVTCTCRREPRHA